MAFLTGTVRGTQQVRRAMRRIETRAARVNLYNATRMVADESIRIAPRDTGRLRRRIRILGRGKVGSNLRYAPFVHWGNRRVSSGRSGHAGRAAVSVYNEEKYGGRSAAIQAARAQGGQPFIYEAVERRTHDIVSDLAKQIDDEVKKQGFRSLSRGLRRAFR